MTGKAKVIFPAVMAFIVSFIMSRVVTAVNLGFQADYLGSWMSAWAFACPVAMGSALVAQAPAHYVTTRVVGWLEGNPASQ